MRPTSIRATLVGAVAVLALGFTGCAGTQPVNPASSTAGATPAKSAATTATLGNAALDMILRSESFQADQQRLNRAELELTRRCMVAHGFGDPTEPRAETSAYDSAWNPDLESRRRIGYGFGPSAPSLAGPHPGKLPPARQAAHDLALLGDPSRRVTLSLPSGKRFTLPQTGCIAESRAKLFGTAIDAGRVFYLPQDAYMTLYDRVVGDPVVREATRRWAVCMAGRGHRYATPDAARSSIAAAYRTAGATGTTRSLDRRVAVADAECTLAAGLPQAFDRTGRRLAARLPADQRRELNSVAELQAAALRRAGGVIGAHG